MDLNACEACRILLMHTHDRPCPRLPRGFPMIEFLTQVNIRQELDQQKDKLDRNQLTCHKTIKPDRSRTPVRFHTTKEAKVLHLGFLDIIETRTRLLSRRSLLIVL